ncbi:SGNH/GDSL hydrolase family protein [Aquabacterium sp.]|uniref:SGNH/GDSL hydrolase family protein n=1 Tax=Aquabacterium sp. TaxID=1872578 RepID=UPI002C9A1383|nr:SGNH/GDSL hydrolase family protein [Aquabacterium sp.]HSW04999.1 SGNH/GDSL hydrolase family protein [Aquabacterium sp.]
MTVLNDVRRRRGWLAGLSMALAVAGLLAACGGGTSQVDPFKPGRVIALGDESSVIVNDGANNGRKYIVNGLDTSAVRDCRLLPNWVQSVSDHYGFVFAECNKDAAAPRAFMRAKVGAKVDDPTLGMAQQIAEQIASGDGFKSNDLVTILIGQNDLIELSERVQAGSMTAADASGEAKRRGTQLAQRVNTILGFGAKGLVVTVPDMGLSPYAITLNKTSPGAAALLSSLSYDFNAALRTEIDQTRFDGRNYGLVLADDTVQSIAKFPGSYGYTNVVDAVCLVAAPNCTTAAADLVSGATLDSYMWSTDRQLSPSLHSRIGSQALTRALNNPF